MTEKELETRVNYEFAHRFNHTLHAYIDIAEDLIAGTLLSQIMYWFSEDKDKKTRVRVKKNGEYWLAKGREEWIREIRISKKQYDCAITKLRDKGLVETKLFKFNGVPTTHIRPIFENISTETEKWKKNIENEILNSEKADKTKEFSDLPKGENGIYQKGKTELPEMDKSITEITNNNTFHFINRSETVDRDFDDEILEKAKEYTDNETILDGINYFLKTFKQRMNKPHPNITYRSLDNVIGNIEELLINVDDIEDFENSNGFRLMVNNYFDTEYTEDVDYKIQHFASGKVLEYQARACGYITGWRE